MRRTLREVTDLNDQTLPDEDHYYTCNDSNINDEITKLRHDRVIGRKAGKIDKVRENKNRFKYAAEYASDKSVEISNIIKINCYQNRCSHQNKDPKYPGLIERLSARKDLNDPITLTRNLYYNNNNNSLKYKIKNSKIGISKNIRVNNISINRIYNISIVSKNDSDHTEHNTDLNEKVVKRTLEEVTDLNDQTLSNEDLSLIHISEPTRPY